MFSSLIVPLFILMIVTTQAPSQICTGMPIPTAEIKNQFLSAFICVLKDIW